MDQTLDNISNSLYNGQLPSDWLRLAPATCMQLGAWMNHLLVKKFLLLTDNLINHLFNDTASKQAVQILVSIGRASSYVVIRFACARKLYNSTCSGITM